MTAWTGMKTSYLYQREEKMAGKSFSQEDTFELLEGDMAIANFKMLSHTFVDLQTVIEKAKAYAVSGNPVLIETAAGPEMEMFAQAIHNGSMRRSGPFILISMSGMTPEQQETTLFGNPRMGSRGAVLDANHGTLVLQGVDKLTLPLQARIAHVIRTRRTTVGTDMSKYKYIDVRFICTTSKNLTRLRKQYLFRSDLLFALKALRIRIPKLMDRPNDVRNMLDFYMDDYTSRYQKPVTISEAARNAVLSYPWEGSVAQLQAFCERMVLTAESRVIKADYVRALQEELYLNDSGIFDDPEETGQMPEGGMEEAAPEPALPGGLQAGGETGDLYRELIEATLRKNNGNRRQTAADLRISTTTLWRKMKQYRLD